MSLSLLIIAALITANMLSLRSIIQIQKIENQINQLSQSLKIIETDLKSAALTACALDKTFIVNSIFNQGSMSVDETDIHWISGYSNNTWHPETPLFVNPAISKKFDAVQFIKADMSNLISLKSLAKTPQRILFVTNCLTSEITRNINSKLLKNASPSEDLSIYAFQFIQYYVREKLGRHTLYRQYFSKSGKPRNEPLVDNIDQLTIGYAEKITNNTLAFNTADNVTDWKNVVAAYISITLTGGLSNPLSALVLLNNHAKG